jgi:uncharacterized RDD family membrane protein YckC
MPTVSIQTTQNVFIHYPAASLGDRILAYFIDTLIIIAYVIACALIMDMINLNSTAIGVSVISIPILLYHLLFEIFMDGQSPGKKQMGIKVVKLDGSPGTIGSYIIRWLIRIIEINLMSGAVAMIAIAAGGKGQRLGDIAAGTAVVKLVRQKEVTAKEIFTIAEDNYVPTFTQVLQLNDGDIEIINQALRVNRNTGNSKPVIAITEKIKTLLGVESDMPPVKFLYTIVKDYGYYTSKL